MISSDNSKEEMQARSWRGNLENQLTSEFLWISSEIDYKWHGCLKIVGVIACCGSLHQLVGLTPMFYVGGINSYVN